MIYISELNTEIDQRITLAAKNFDKISKKSKYFLTICMIYLTFSKVYNTFIGLNSVNKENFMNRAQKMSLTLVITISLGLFLGIVLVVMRFFNVGIPKTVFLFPIFFAGSGGIISLIFFRKDKSAITSDERDKLIEKNANLAGFGAVYLFVILASFLPIGIMGQKGSIPVTWCPVLLVGAAFCQAYAQSLAILIQYGWGGGHGKS
ncbi:MAG: hypothetical protein A2167_01250 [Planctomycetes bacterium RBG_13_46_10]|nr:MAG: hypothetical protein A2167_01250 [Planctomycetes bacterium RBG_13_46_10]